MGFFFFFTPELNFWIEGIMPMYGAIKKHRAFQEAQDAYCSQSMKNGLWNPESSPGHIVTGQIIEGLVCHAKPLGFTYHTSNFSPKQKRTSLELKWLKQLTLVCGVLGCIEKRGNLFKCKKKNAFENPKNDVY